MSINSSFSDWLKEKAFSRVVLPGAPFTKATAPYPTTRILSPVESPELAYFSTLASVAPSFSAAIIAAMMGPPPQASHTRRSKLRDMLR